MDLLIENDLSIMALENGNFVGVFTGMDTEPRMGCLSSIIFLWKIFFYAIKNPRVAPGIELLEQIKKPIENELK